MPFISVIIPSYNRAHILPAVVQEVLGQSFDDFELIIVDDGSTDNTIMVVQDFADARIKYISQPNVGVCAARNTGIQQAIGSWITFVDSDDSVTKNWLLDFYKATKTNDAEMLVCRRVTITDPVTPRRTFLPGSFAIRKDVLDSLGGYDENIKYGENTELKWRFQQGGYQLKNIDGVNLVYDDTSTGGSKNKKNQVDFF
jgi:glycosyltransferase involved in cell wall biosynthesis